MQTEFETYGIYRDRSKYINREVAIFFKLQSLCSRPMPLKITVISYQNGGKSIISVCLSTLMLKVMDIVHALHTLHL